MLSWRLLSGREMLTTEALHHNWAHCCLLPLTTGARAGWCSSLIGQSYTNTALWLAEKVSAPRARGYRHQPRPAEPNQSSLKRIILRRCSETKYGIVMDGDMKIEVLISDRQTHQDLWEDKNERSSKWISLLNISLVTISTLWVGGERCSELGCRAGGSTGCHPIIPPRDQTLTPTPWASSLCFCISTASAAFLITICMRGKIF